MTQHTNPRKLRGIVAVRANASDPTKILAEMQKAFEEFKAERDAEIKDLKKGQEDVVRTEKIDRINTEITDLTKALDAANKAIAAMKIGGAGGDIDPAAAEHAQAFEKWFRKGERAIDADLRELEVKAALSTDSDPDGGYLVPEEMSNEIDRVTGTVSAMRDAATVMTIGTDTYKKLHNIGGSVVILDEAQTLPLKLLRPAVAAIDELARNYRSSIVLCTATQPALQAPEFVGGLNDVRELAPEPPALFRKLERVRIRHVGVLNDAELTAEVQQREQVLCVVNNRRHARALYESIADIPGARHLSTLMCAKHRSAALAEIRAMLARGEPCRLISTSLVEAGVDISLPSVLRAEAGLDSIAQAAGRCNRNKEWPVDASEVLVFTTSNDDWAAPSELRQYAQVAQEILRQPQYRDAARSLLGATDVPAFVLSNGCTGFLYALTTAQQFISSGAYDNVLVIGAELLSRYVDWTDRNTCVLFGDAAAAFVLQATTEPCGLLSFDMGSDGSGSQHIIAPAAGSAEPVNASTFEEGRHFIRMNGREVFKFATRILGTTSQRSLAQAGLSLEDIDRIVPHQANLRIIQAAARSMDLPMDRFLVTVHKYANTSAASIPLAICDGLESGEIKLDDRLLLVSFGSGLTWASAVLQMAPVQSHQVYTNGASAPAISELVTA